MRDLLSAVAAKWHAEGAKPMAGASTNEIDAFETKYLVRMPDDLRAYFSLLNGMSDDSMSSELINFWDLRRVQTVAEELTSKGPVSTQAGDLFCFADYSIWCNAYAVRLSAHFAEPAPVVAVYSGVDLIATAGSFTAFLSAYVSATPETVLHPRWKKDGKLYGAAT